MAHNIVQDRVDGGRYVVEDPCHVEEPLVDGVVERGGSSVDVE